MLKTRQRTYFIQLIITLFLLINCSNNDTITPTLNTDEYFKYTLNNGTERVFDGNITAYHVQNPSPNYQRLFFRASANTSNGGSVFVDGDFIYPNYNSFITTSLVPWGLSTVLPITNQFYFSELLSDDGFKFIPHFSYSSSPINCTIVSHATNVGDYLEFTFTGSYTHVTDASITGTITGSARMKRENDR